MGFLKKVGNALGSVAQIAATPVTAPLNALAGANIPIVSSGAAGVSALTTLPASALRGESVPGVIRGAAANLQPAVGAVASVEGAGFNLGGLGQTLQGIPGFSVLSNLQGTPPSGLNVVPDTKNNPVYSSAPNGSGDYTGILIIGGGVLLATYLILRK